MSNLVSDLAQLIEDAHYQDFRPADGFWRKEQFEQMVIAADAKLKQDEYKEQVALNLRRRAPNADVNLSSSNYVTVEAAVIEGEKATLPDPIMRFPGASASLSVSQVRAEGNCGNFMPIEPNQVWQVCGIKDVVFWHPDECGIKFLHLKENCNPNKVFVTYIPELQAKSTIAENRRWAILNMVTIFLKSAKDGVVIDMSNNYNRNVLPQAEVDSDLLKALRQ